MATKGTRVGITTAAGILVLLVLAGVLIRKAGKTGQMTLTLQSVTTNETGAISYTFAFENKAYDCVIHRRVMVQNTSGRWASVPYNLGVHSEGQANVRVGLGEKATFTFDYPDVTRWFPRPGEYVAWKPEIQCQRVNAPKWMEAFERVNQRLQLQAGLPLIVQVERGRPITGSPIELPETVEGSAGTVITPSRSRQPPLFPSRRR